MIPVAAGQGLGGCISCARPVFFFFYTCAKKRGDVPESEKHVSCPCVKVANAKVGRFRDGHQDRVNRGGSVPDGKDVAVQTDCQLPRRRERDGVPEQRILSHCVACIH
jgi:hypothetical protein